MHLLNYIKTGIRYRYTFNPTDSTINPTLSDLTINRFNSTLSNSYSSTTDPTTATSMDSMNNSTIFSTNLNSIGCSIGITNYDDLTSDNPKVLSRSLGDYGLDDGYMFQYYSGNALNHPKFNDLKVFFISPTKAILFFLVNTSLYYSLITITNNITLSFSKPVYFSYCWNTSFDVVQLGLYRYFITYNDQENINNRIIQIDSTASNVVVGQKIVFYSYNNRNIRNVLVAPNKILSVWSANGTSSFAVIQIISDFDIYQGDKYNYINHDVSYPVMNRINNNTVLIAGIVPTTNLTKTMKLIYDTSTNKILSRGDTNISSSIINNGQDVIRRVEPITENYFIISTTGTYIPPNSGATYPEITTNKLKLVTMNSSGVCTLKQELIIDQFSVQIRNLAVDQYYRFTTNDIIPYIINDKYFTCVRTGHYDLSYIGHPINVGLYHYE